MEVVVLLQVKVQQGARELFSWFKEVSTVSTIAELWDALCVEEEADLVGRELAAIFLSTSAGPSKLDSPLWKKQLSSLLASPALFACKLQGVAYHLQPQLPRVPAAAAGSALDKLIAKSHSLLLPEPLVAKPGGQLTRKHDLHNDVLRLLEESQLGFSADEVSKGGVAHNFVSRLVDTLWLIDPQQRKLAEADCRLPDRWKHFLVKPYNDPSSHRHTVPRLTVEVLTERRESLASALSSAFAIRKSWKDMTLDVQALVILLEKYCTMLLGKRQSVQARHEEVHATFACLCLFLPQLVCCTSLAADD